MSKFSWALDHIENQLRHIIVPIKGNDCLGCKSLDDETHPRVHDTALMSAGRNLISCGLVEIIALSLGPLGAMLISRDRALRAHGLLI